MMFFFQAEDGIRDLVRSRGLGDVYKRQSEDFEIFGELEHGWERFMKNTNYRAFIIKLKDEDN